MSRFSLSAALMCSAASPLLAEVPAVATDIAPVHALVSQVMAGVGEPALIVPPKASPHGYAMRPSEARALNGADLVVWVGPALTPWLAEPLETLANGAAHLALMEQPGTRVLPFREGATFEAHDHADYEGHEDHGDHADHADHAEHNDHAEHDNHAQGHGSRDPHVWLDPRNGLRWLGQIAEALADLDPDNAAIYRANATTAAEGLTALEADLEQKLAPLRDRPFIVFHDGFHYFEARFDIEAIGAISENDARPPGAARVAELRALVQESGAACVFAEPQFNPGLIAAVTEGQEARTGTLDPIGAALTPGAGLYEDLLRGMAEGMAACLTD